MKTPRMIGMDFDLTLIGYGPGGCFIPPKTQELLAEQVRAGREVGIVSGRVAHEMADLVTRAGMTWGKPFPTFYISRESYIFWRVADKFLPDEEWNAARAEEMKVLARTICAHTPGWLDALAERNLVPKHWIIWGEYCLEMHFHTMEEAEQARVHLVDWTRAVPLARAHRNRFMAHVLLDTGGKGRSLLHAATSRGIAPDEVLAVGDTLNDMDMLDGRYGLCSGAVGNADDSLKDAVRANNGIIATGNAGFGLAEIIRKATGAGPADALPAPD